MSAEPLTAKDLELFEMAGGSPDPQYVPGSSLFGKGDIVFTADGTSIKSLGEKSLGEKDEGAVQSGGARRLRRRRRSNRSANLSGNRSAKRKTRRRTGRSRSTRNRSANRRPRFSLSLRTQIRLHK